MQGIHWGVVIIVVIAVFILSLRGDIDKASVTALYGLVLGHAGSAASQKLGTRSTDSPATSNATKADPAHDQTGF